MKSDPGMFKKEVLSGGVDTIQQLVEEQKKTLRDGTKRSSSLLDEQGSASKM